MLRQSLFNITRPAIRSFSISSRAMAEGATGAPRASGQGDAFSKREKASEDYAIREREKEKLLDLKKKLAEQQDHLKKLEDHLDELTKAQEKGTENK